MPIFICAKCGCVDNTATSSYWMQNIGYESHDLKYDDSLTEYKGRPLCSECGRYVCGKTKDGQYVEAIVPGRWHGRFPKREATKEDRKRCDPNTGIIRY